MFKRNEALLLLGVLVVAALVYGLARLTAPELADGARVRIQVDGETPVDLDPSLYAARGEPYTIIRNVDDKERRNVIQITKQGVRMAEANCLDHSCERMGILRPGAGAIVCLPHKLIVSWVPAPGSAPEELDVVLQ